MSLKINYQRGVALIQSIVLAAVMSIIALYLNHSAKGNVQQAQLLSDRAKAMVRLHEVESELLFSLFTEQLINGPTENGAFNWRFNGNLFKKGDNSVLSIQDEAGLLGLYPLRSSLLEKSLRKLGYSRQDAIMVVNSLLDWQDSDSEVRDGSAEEGGYNFGPRNKPMPEVQELNWIPQIPKALRTELEQLLTIHTPMYFNPANAPDVLLKAYLDVERLPSEVIQFRAGKLRGETFADVAGLNLEEGINFATSSTLRVTMHTKVGGASVAKQFTIAIDRYNANPDRVLAVLNRFWGQRALNHLYEKTNMAATDAQSF